MPKQNYRTKQEGGVEKREAKTLSDFAALHSKGTLGERDFRVARVMQISKKGRKLGAHGVFDLTLNGSLDSTTYVVGKCIQFAALAKELRPGDIVLIEPEGDIFMFHCRLKRPDEIALAVTLGAGCSPAFLAEDIFDEVVEAAQEAAELAAAAADDDNGEEEVNMDDL